MRTGWASDERNKIDRVKNMSGCQIGTLTYFVCEQRGVTVPQVGLDCALVGALGKQCERVKFLAGCQFGTLLFIGVGEIVSQTHDLVDGIFVISVLTYLGPIRMGYCLDAVEDLKLLDRNFIKFRESLGFKPRFFVAACPQRSLGGIIRVVAVPGNAVLVVNVGAFHC